jgi:hypothetical protein
VAHGSDVAEAAVARSEDIETAAALAEAAEGHKREGA